MPHILSFALRVSPAQEYQPIAWLLLQDYNEAIKDSQGAPRRRRAARWRGANALDIPMLRSSQTRSVQRRYVNAIKQLAQLRKLVSPKTKAVSVKASEDPLLAVNATEPDLAAAAAFPRIA